MLKKLKSESGFSRNILTLMTGTTITFIVLAIATKQYEMAIMLQKKDEDVINIVVLPITISFFIGSIAFFIVFFFNTEITNLLSNPEISNWLYFIPFMVLLMGIYWSNRKKQYKDFCPVINTKCTKEYL